MRIKDDTLEPISEEGDDTSGVDSDVDNESTNAGFHSPTFEKFERELLKDAADTKSKSDEVNKKKPKIEHHYTLDLKITKLLIPSGRNSINGRFVIYHPRKNLELYGEANISAQNIISKYSLKEEKVLGDAKFSWNRGFFSIDAKDYSISPLISEVAQQSKDLLVEFLKKHKYACDRNSVSLPLIEDTHMLVWKELGYTIGQR